MFLQIASDWTNERSESIWNVQVYVLLNSGRHCNSLCFICRFSVQCGFVLYAFENTFDFVLELGKTWTVI